jgi:ATP-binding cassette subfamily C (CFTR/MRP) protein 1
VPWIQNKTIRDNILFGLQLDKAKYVDVIRMCELERDLEILPAGDLTEIGEKGINLSGGQKARISLARAVYSDKDIILMDDPISALDASVRKKVIMNLILKFIRNKTRVLVTHAIDFIHLSDKVILMQNGRIVAQGTYSELRDNE